MTQSRPFLPAPRTCGLACATILLFPSSTVAQKQPFVEAFATFHSSLAGTYGDEGPRALAALDRMEATLAAWDQATRDTQAALRSRPGTRPADLALLYVERGRFIDAIGAFDAAIREEPRRAPLHVFRGLILELTGQPGEATAAFGRAAEIDTANAAAAYLAASRRPPGADRQPLLTALAAARVAAAAGPAIRFPQLGLMEDGAAATPIFSPAAYAEGFAHVAAGRYERAVAVFRQIAARDPLMVDPATRTEGMVRGLASLRQGQGAAAIAALDSVAAALPTSSEAHRMLGIAYRAMGENQKSVDHLEAAVRLGPDDERAGVALGRALAASGRTADAERVLRQVVALQPASGEARWALADLFERTDRGLEAMAVLEEASGLIVLAGQAPLLWRLAEIAHRHQEFDKVIAALAMRVRLMANDGQAHKDLGAAYGRVGLQDEALTELLMACILGAEDAEVLTSIGQIHLDAGRYELAARELERAVALAPTLPQARYALGTTLMRWGKPDAGKQHLVEFQRLRTASLERQRFSFDVDSLIHQADLLTREGKLEPAVALLEKAGGLDPRPGVFDQLATLLAKLNRPADSARAKATADRLRATPVVEP